MSTQQQKIDHVLHKKQVDGVPKSQTDSQMQKTTLRDLQEKNKVLRLNTFDFAPNAVSDKPLVSESLSIVIQEIIKEGE